MADDRLEFEDHDPWTGTEPASNAPSEAARDILRKLARGDDMSAADLADVLGASLEQGAVIEPLFKANIAVLQRLDETQRRELELRSLNSLQRQRAWKAWGDVGSALASFLRSKAGTALLLSAGVLALLIVGQAYLDPDTLQLLPILGGP